MTSTRNKTAQQKQPRSRGAIIAGVLGAVVIIALVGAVVFGSTEPGSEYGSPEVTGQLPLMPPNNSVDPTAAGFDAPIVVGQDFDGEEVRIENDGRAKAIVFLAHWCPHCQAEVPRVQAWLDETGGVEGVDIYSVSTSMNSGQPNFPASDWLDREAWTPPLIRDDSDNTVLIAHGRGGFPFWVFVDANGKVALRVSGETQIAELESIMQALATS